jgi:hypothetical protein
MDGITGDYTTNIGVAWQQMKYIGNVDDALSDKNKQLSDSVNPRGDTVTISDEARSMSTASSRGAAPVGETARNPMVGENRGGARKGGRAASGARPGGARGASGTSTSDDNAAEIAELEANIQKVKAEIRQLRRKADDDEKIKLQLANKQSELERLQSQLAKLKSEEASGGR